MKCFIDKRVFIIFVICFVILMSSFNVKIIHQAFNKSFFVIILPIEVAICQEIEIVAWDEIGNVSKGVCFFILCISTNVGQDKWVILRKGNLKLNFQFQKRDIEIFPLPMTIFRRANCRLALHNFARTLAYPLERERKFIRFSLSYYLWNRP